MSDRLEELLSLGRARSDKLLSVLERWVRQNSYSGSVEGVNRMGALLEEDFDLPGLSMERHEGDGVGDHLVWRTPAFEERVEGRILLIGHHDTVFPPGGFETWEIDGDRLSGPGVLDMKGGLAVIHAALAAFADAGALAEMPIGFMSVGDEEIGSWHSRPLIEAVARGARGALVFEGGRAKDMIITQRKGTGAVIAVAAGVAAHAGNHHADGVNAIWALSKLIDRAQALTDYERGVTVNVGLIEGGEARNTVPAHARCQIDLRFIHASDGHELVSGLEQAAAEISAELGAEISFEGGLRRQPLERSDGSAALCERYAVAARAAGLGHEEAPLIGGGSDASTVSSVGVPAIDGLGPRGKGFHTHDEHIAISSLAPKVEALVRFLAAECS